MAAVVKHGGKSRYYMHRITMPDGSEFEFNKKTEPIGAGVPTKHGNQGSAVSSVLDNSVSENSSKIKKGFSLKEDAGITYEKLTNKPDMRVVKIGKYDVSPYQGEKARVAAKKIRGFLKQKNSFGETQILSIWN